MRIITGNARGTKLFTLDGTDITRPTTERVKEAIFSMIQFDIEGRRVLDLFAGSGQLGLEALSRGAASAIFVDADKAAIEIIRKNIEKTKMTAVSRIINSDYKAALKSLSGREKFDIVFLDPPYATKNVSNAISALLKGNLLADGAILVCESDIDKPFSGDGFTEVRFARYSHTYVTLLVKEGGEQ